MAHEALGLMESLGYKGSVPYATTLLNVATAYRAAGQIAKPSSCSRKSPRSMTPT